ncbi:hypothetical protein BO219_06460 [Anoxybacillus kestanbolensis]|uniref:Fibronectin type-III domain-containing protein n=1 Tax=Anoxybacillus kestanbolensis TaxID=227476 RepID=A0A1V3FTI7_9BACL|nr:fibronectin type III domain-containing protein [Anoxybacillus kestanbolensis]OOE05023.1 hypothetical protein BO219_06460 [Anoxybacillus kestanbolensis]
MKRILPFIAFIVSFIFLFTPFSRDVFAFNGGLLNNKTIYFGAYVGHKYSRISTVTDNELSTYQDIFEFNNYNTIWHQFSIPTKIGSFYLKSSTRLNLVLYSSNMTKLYERTHVSSDDIQFLDSLVDNVSYVALINTGTGGGRVYEFDVFSNALVDTMPPSNVNSLVASSIKSTSFSVDWSNPSDTDFDGTKIYLNNILVTTLDKTKTSYTFNGLNPNTTYTVKVTSFDTSQNESSGVTLTVKTLPPPDVTNLELFPSTYSILAQWINPTDSGFIGNDIYLDGNFITSLDKDATSYNFTNLNPNTSYAVKVVSKFIDGYSSTGQTATAKTTIPVEDVADLQADAKYDRVKLSWTPPNSEFFSHVKIYRKNVEQQSFWDQLFGTTSVSAETPSDGYTPMFETNGTYWTDLTVTPETTYSYKVTSVNIEGDESQGVTVETTTPSEPVPVLSGVATTQNENGDYVVTWASPTKGIVKVLIAGKEYAQVDAATKQIVIKKEDMKTDFFGAYAATLIPIGEYGTKGQAVTVPSLGEKIDFPLSFQDFMETVVSILAWVAPFIVLSLVFIFWRPIFNFIKKAISERRVKQ